ncbi:MAG: type IV pilus secretin PilQ, partial [Ralstonia sp.]
APEAAAAPAEAAPAPAPAAPAPAPAAAPAAAPATERPPILTMPAGDMPSDNPLHPVPSGSY